MTSNVAYALRRRWWRRFHPLVRVGWYAATAGSSRPVIQTAFGIGLMAAGIVVRGSQKNARTPIYVHTLNPGESARIRVYRGTSAPSDVTVKA